MNVFELATAHGQTAGEGVPAWMRGHFRRRSITFADGRSDELTQVHWLQSRSFTIDLRLPAGPVLPARALDAYAADELRTLANYEGWMADSLWQDGQLSWQGGVALQLHNRWPEPAPLQRVGNCMIEFAPSGAYVEDWRLQPDAGPLIGLRLVDERDARSGELLHRGGGLIVCGEYAGWTHGRPAPLPASPLGLRERAARAQGDAAALGALFDFETSLARGDAQSGHRVVLSTVPARIGQALVLDGFEPPVDGRVRQRLCRADGRALLRTFDIDILQPDWRADPVTPCTVVAARWFEDEGETLGRYLERVR